MWRDQIHGRIQAIGGPTDQLHDVGVLLAAGNVIVRKKTLEDNDYNLRKLVTHPGTGPVSQCQGASRTKSGSWRGNPNYWNKGLPYLDGIEF